MDTTLPFGNVSPIKGTDPTETESAEIGQHTSMPLLDHSKTTHSLNNHQDSAIAQQPSGASNSPTGNHTFSTRPTTMALLGTQQQMMKCPFSSLTPRWTKNATQTTPPPLTSIQQWRNSHQAHRHNLPNGQKSTPRAKNSKPARSHSQTAPLTRPNMPLHQRLPHHTAQPNSRMLYHPRTTPL
jgi:hypothetical protein